MGLRESLVRMGGHRFVPTDNATYMTGCDESGQSFWELAVWQGDHKTLQALFHNARQCLQSGALTDTEHDTLKKHLQESLVLLCQSPKHHDKHLETFLTESENLGITLDVNQPSLKYHRTPLTAATMQHHEKKMLCLLEEHHADPNTADNYQETPLTLAVSRYEVKEGLFDTKHVYQTHLVKNLLDHHADPNQTNPKGESPLVAAIHLGSPASVSHLLEHSADANAEVSWKSKKTTPLLAAVERRSPRLTEMLLQNPHGEPADPNQPVVIGTHVEKLPLTTAIADQTTSLPVIRLLLDHDADMEAKGIGSRPWLGRNDCKTALHHAFDHRQEHTIALLASYGADLFAPLEAKNPDGSDKTLFQHAAEERSKYTVFRTNKTGHETAWDIWHHFNNTGLYAQHSTAFKACFEAMLSHTSEAHYHDAKEALSSPEGQAHYGLKDMALRRLDTKHTQHMEARLDHVVDSTAFIQHAMNQKREQPKEPAASNPLIHVKPKDAPKPKQPVDTRIAHLIADFAVTDRPSRQLTEGALIGRYVTRAPYTDFKSRKEEKHQHQAVTEVITR